MECKGEIVNKKLNLDEFFNSYSELGRIYSILGMDSNQIKLLLDLGFIFDYNDYVFKTIYDFKISDTLIIPFDVNIGKTNEGYNLSLCHKETSIKKDFMTYKDFNSYIYPLNGLFQLKSFIEKDKWICLYFTFLENIKNCIKNENGFIEIENSKIIADGYSKYPISINDKEIWYQSYTKDTNTLEKRRDIYGYNSGFVNEKYYSKDDKDLCKTSEGYYLSWQGKKYVSHLKEDELEYFSKILIEPLETAKNKKTFKKFVEENK